MKAQSGGEINLIVRHGVLAENCVRSLAFPMVSRSVLPADFLPSLLHYCHSRLEPQTVGLFIVRSLACSTQMASLTDKQLRRGSKIGESYVHPDWDILCTIALDFYCIGNRILSLPDLLI